MERIIGGKYKLGRKIGGGSFGEIYLATHVDSFETVSVKIVSLSRFNWICSFLLTTTGHLQIRSGTSPSRGVQD
ncbi:hypothetical protein HA466_0206130 [Hirschfeldia incana]|nr:hypothetical protein HA466_0206130 [Hirschfeldia incana]KAJ0242673.1 hypothetical protein HA466_0206130 [Hirschfeldia incana]